MVTRKERINTLMNIPLFPTESNCNRVIYTPFTVVSSAFCENLMDIMSNLRQSIKIRMLRRIAEAVAVISSEKHTEKYLKIII